MRSELWEVPTVATVVGVILVGLVKFLEGFLKTFAPRAGERLGDMAADALFPTQAAPAPSPPAATASPPPAAAAGPAPAPRPEPPPPAALPGGPGPEIQIRSLSPMFYWWPVWMLGFMLAALTYFENTRSLVFPATARIEATADEGTYLLVLPPGTPPTESLREAAAHSAAGSEPAAQRMADGRRPYGVLFFTVLAFVILVTTVGLGGGASVAVVLGVVIISIVLSLTGTASGLLAAIGSLGIQLNLAGYLFISTALFTMWLAALWVFPRCSVVLTPGRILIKEPGEPDRVYDVRGTVVEKSRSDLFRHWILGMGTGDLTIRLANGRTIRVPDVPFLAQKLQRIQELFAAGR